MADNENTGSGDDNETLREEGMRALKAERESNKALKAQLKELAEWKEAQESAGKSETEKLTAETARLKAEYEKASKDSLRLRVAMKKGLTESQARRLVGNDENELAADADDLLASFKPVDTNDKDDEGATGTGLDPRPRERLKGGARPAEPGLLVDPDELAKKIPRR